jgi:hypothetical protein
MRTQSLERIDMQAAARYWARITGTPRPHRGTMIRWAIKGVRGRRLRAEPLAGRWYTTTEAIDEFLRHMTQPIADCLDTPASPARAAQVERAIGELDRMIERKPAGRRIRAK